MEEEKRSDRKKKLALICGITTASVLLPFGPLSGGVGFIVGSLVGVKISNSIKSDIWFERTERYTYTAPSGHVIYDDPDY